MRRASGLGLLVVGLVGLMGASALADDETPIGLASIPAPVRGAIDEALPGADWTSASLETGDDETTYEVRGTDAAGHSAKVEVDLAADGSMKVQPEIRMGRGAGATAATGAVPSGQGAVPLWLYAAGLVTATFGFLARVVFSDLLESVGSGLAKALGCDRLSRAIKARLLARAVSQGDRGEV